MAKLNYKDILINLVLRNLRVKYKSSVLGFLWIFLEPILTMVILGFVFSKVMRIQIEKYPLFLLSAILPWTFFSKSLSESTVSIVENANLVKNIYFLREALPMSSVVSNFVNLLVELLIFLPVLILFKVPFNMSIIFLPTILLFHLLFTIGLGLFSSCVNVYFRDVNYLVRFALMLWFYMTPVFYPLSMVPDKVRNIYKLNPMVSIITMYRNVLFEGKSPLFLDMWIAFTSGIIAVIIGYIVFKKYQYGFAKEI